MFESHLWTPHHLSLGDIVEVANLFLMFAQGTNIQNAHGLNRIQIQLLNQRGNVGEPTPSLSIRVAGEKLISIAATVNWWSMAPKQKQSDYDLADEPLLEEIEPEVPQKGAEPVEE
ncbi:unnamed protein product [Mortierella alpina]